MGDGNVRVFISCVSDEFREYRDKLRHDLTRHNAEVKVQEDFIDFGASTLDKLDRYIANCDAVIHLVGDMTGSLPKPVSTSAIRGRYPDLAEKLPPLAALFEQGTAISYTQWEAWLARYHGRRLFVAVPATEAPRGPRYSATDESKAAMAAHLKALRTFESYGITFRSPDDLAAQMLRSAILDLLVDAKIAGSAPGKPVNLPYPAMGTLFKGRDQFMERLRGVLGNPAAKAAAVTGKALYGLGGIGKTRLAIEFAHRHADEYSALLFLSAETPQQLNASLANLVGPLVLNLPQKDEREDEVKIAAALAWLNANPGWFLILFPAHWDPKLRIPRGQVVAAASIVSPKY